MHTWVSDKLRNCLSVTDVYWMELATMILRLQCKNNDIIRFIMMSVDECSFDEF